MTDSQKAEQETDNRAIERGAWRLVFLTPVSFLICGAILVAALKGVNLRPWIYASIAATIIGGLLWTRFTRAFLAGEGFFAVIILIVAEFTILTIIP